MTRILVITHGNLAKELIQIAEMALEKKSLAIPVCFCVDNSLESFQRNIAEIMASFQPEESVLILTDLCAHWNLFYQVAIYSQTVV